MTRQLKLDLNVLKQIFSENHERFRILNTAADELTCRFILKDGKFCDIQASITVSLVVFLQKNVNVIRLHIVFIRVKYIEFLLFVLITLICTSVRRFLNILI